MGLSTELISQFVKLTTPEKKKSETTSYGTFCKKNGKDYVQLDGSDKPTPVISTTSTYDGDRVMVLVKNHNAIITGNLTKPSANTVEVNKIDKIISEFYTVMSYKVSTNELSAIDATIESLKAKTANITDIESVTADIESLQSKFATLDHVYATDVDALNAEIENIRSEFANISTISTEDLDAINADIDKLKGYTADFTYVSADILSALKAEVDKLDATHLQATYANIDFSNITESTMAKFYSNSGLIKDATIGDATITGELQGVTISGNLLKGSTVVADKLVLKGEDGLYYKLNTDGIKTEAEQTEYNSLNGDIFMAKSITATKINVSDLVAFGATIGGFKLTDSSLYSGVKQTVGNTTRGIYLDNDGQIAFGDASKYIKFFKDTDSNYKLLISGAVTANENFKILTDGSMEAKNGSFKGTIDADNGSIGGIDISNDGVSAESITDEENNVVQGFHVTKNGEISSYNTGTGIDYTLAISSGTLTLSSEGTASGSNPAKLGLESTGIYIKYDGSYMAKFYTNGSAAYIDAQYGLVMTGSLTANAGISIPSPKTLRIGNGTYAQGTIELYGESPYIDFHRNNSTSDYTHRIIASDDTYLQITSGLRVKNGFQMYVGERWRTPITMYAGPDANGDAVLYGGAGGLTIVGAGESASSFLTGYINDGNNYGVEQLHLTSDQSVYITTYMQGGYDSSKKFTFSTDGHFILPSGGTIKFGNDTVGMISSRTGGGFDFYLDSTGTNDIVKIVFDANGKIYKVNKAGTWTTIAG